LGGDGVETGFGEQGEEGRRRRRGLVANQFERVLIILIYLQVGSSKKMRLGSPMSSKATLRRFF
jgi:hypothetical protein